MIDKYADQTVISKRVSRTYETRRRRDAAHCETLLPLRRVRGLENIPPGGCLVVANHSGGMLTPDWSVFAVAYYDTFGYDRPLYEPFAPITRCFAGPADRLLRVTGIIRATRENAANALAADAVVLVFPGGDYDVYRPTKREVIGFAGRTGCVTSATEAGAPLVPMVYGGQEAIPEPRRWLARAPPHPARAKAWPHDILPITFGFPFGLSVLMPVNMPLPTKIVGQVLPPIDIAAEFGDEPEVDQVDAHVRAVMQTALARLARQRRLPVVG